jgi:hypothetical protein
LLSLIILFSCSEESSGPETNEPDSTTTIIYSEHYDVTGDWELFAASDSIQNYFAQAIIENGNLLLSAEQIIGYPHAEAFMDFSDSLGTETEGENIIFEFHLVEADQANFSDASITITYENELLTIPFGYYNFFDYDDSIIHLIYKVDENIVYLKINDIQINYYSATDIGKLGSILFSVWTGEPGDSSSVLMRIGEFNIYKVDYAIR